MLFVYYVNCKFADLQTVKCNQLHALCSGILMFDGFDITRNSRYQIMRHNSAPQWRKLSV